MPTFFEVAEKDRKEEAEVEERRAFNEEPCLILEDGAAKCQICHEPFKTFWNEEEEEWMMRNALKVANIVFINLIENICFIRFLV